ncbi:MAG: GNAT family N-acetyltransferase [Chloroflexota bacterium]
MTDSLWKTLIDKQPSSVFHTPSWMRVLADTYNFEIRAHLLTEPSSSGNVEGAPVAGLPFCQVADIRGRRIVSLPFCDFYDPIVDNPKQWFELVEPLVGEGIPYKIRPLHSSIPLTDTRFQMVNKARWHGLKLAPSLDDLWHSLHGSVRTAVRKAQKNGVIIRVAQNESDLKAFYQMHLLVRKQKYRMVAQPYQFFYLIWKEFIQSNNGYLLLAVYQNQIIAATIFLRWQKTIYYKFNASIPTELHVNPNELLLWSGMKYGKESGCEQLDFGLSDWDQEGLIFYKRKFAQKEKPIHFLQFMPDGYSSHELDKVNQLLPQLTDLLTDKSVPDEITQRAGELLYRNFC